MPDPLPAARSAARLVLLVLALGCAGAGAQELYKLVDKNGRVTYSDTVPRDFKGRVIPLHVDPNLNSSEALPAAGQEGEGRGESPADRTIRKGPANEAARERRGLHAVSFAVKPQRLGQRIALTHPKERLSGGV